MLCRKNILVCALSSLISFFYSSGFAQNSVSQNVPMRKVFVQFTAYAKKAQKEWHIPGMAIAIVKDGKIVYAKGFGERNEKGAAVTPNTIFDIASLTKSFTAALLAMQIDEGKYTWNTKVLKLDPTFKLYDSDATKEFEIRDLIAHDSGLPEDATDSLGNFGYDVDHKLYALRFIKPISKFRTQFAYEDIFPMLAGKIIGKFYSHNYISMLHQRLLAPLDMNNTYVEGEERLEKLKNVSQRFEYFSGKIYAYPMNSAYVLNLRKLEKNPGAAAASGGICSSATDIAKWLIFNINDGLIGKTQLISKKNMNFIHSPQTAIKSSSPDDNLNGESEKFYGEGWFIDKQEYKPYTVLYHSGGGRGVHVLMAYIPQKKVGIVILTNTRANNVPEALYQHFFDLYLDKKPLKNWSDIYLQEWKKFAGREKKAISEPIACQIIKASDLEKYTGVYNNSVYGDLKMSKQGDHLSLKIGPASIIWKLMPCKNNVFQAYWPNAYGMKLPMFFPEQGLVTFTIKKDGAVDKMTIPYLNGDGSGVFIKK